MSASFPTCWFKETETKLNGLNFHDTQWDMESRFFPPFFKSKFKTTIKQEYWGCSTLEVSSWLHHKYFRKLFSFCPSQTSETSQNPSLLLSSYFYSWRVFNIEWRRIFTEDSLTFMLKTHTKPFTEKLMNCHWIKDV